MRFLITGGAGFIGSAFTRFLIKETKHEALVVDKLSYASSLESLSEVSKNDRFKFLKTNICDHHSIEKAFLEFQPNRVINLAAESHVDRSLENPEEFIKSNIQGTFNLLERARDFWSHRNQEDFLFLHVSTDEVYGSLGATGSFTEESRYDPRSPYSASKASSDHLARSWHATFGLPVIVTNCSNNFGPFQFPEKLIPLTIVNALSRKNLPVYGTGKNIRDWIYVEDHARALYQVAMQGVSGESYNIGGRNEKSNIDVVNAICQILNSTQDTDEQFDYRELIYFVEDRPGHDFRYSIDNTKIERDLRWSPEETFESGLKKTVDWYLENRQWCASISQNYNQERLGLTTTEL